MKLKIGDKVLLKKRIYIGYEYWEYLFFNEGEYESNIGTIECYNHNYFLIKEDRDGLYSIYDIDKIILRKGDT